MSAETSSAERCAELVKIGPPERQFVVYYRVPADDPVSVTADVFQVMEALPGDPDPLMVEQVGEGTVSIYEASSLQSNLLHLAVTSDGCCDVEMDCHVCSDREYGLLLELMRIVHGRAREHLGNVT